MNDLPRQKLREMVSQRNVLDDPRLCEALLRDLCGEHKREIFVLVAALKERVAADLLASPNGVPHEVLLSRLTRRLQDNLGLTEESAQWAVDSWALALSTFVPRELRARQHATSQYILHRATVQIVCAQFGTRVRRPIFFDDARLPPALSALSQTQVSAIAP